MQTKVLLQKKLHPFFYQLCENFIAFSWQHATLKEQLQINFAKVPILKECHFRKVKLWQVEHFWTLFVFTFGRDCYCIQQSRPKMKTKSVQKCSTSQSFTLPKWHSFKIGTLTIPARITCATEPHDLIYSLQLQLLNLTQSKWLWICSKLRVC